MCGGIALLLHNGRASGQKEDDHVRRDNHDPGDHSACFGDDDGAVSCWEGCDWYSMLNMHFTRKACLEDTRWDEMT